MPMLSAFAASPRLASAPAGRPAGTCGVVVRATEGTEPRASGMLSQRGACGAQALHDAKGLVFIANDGNYALEADAAIYLISRILGNGCSSINSVVYFTVNMIASGPMTSKQIFIWVHANRKAIIEPVDSKFVMQIFDSWRTYMEHLRNESIEKILMDRPALDQIRYDKNS